MWRAFSEGRDRRRLLLHVVANFADSGNYAARATALRDTAKWIAAIFAGAGAVLFSGLSFANVAQAASTEDWLIPVILATVPVLAAAWAVREASAVITAEPPETRALIGALGKPEDLDASARQEVERLLPATVVTYGSLADFDERLQAAHTRVDGARQRYAAQRIAERLEELETTYRDLDTLQDGVRDVVLAADYAGVKARYKTARWRLLGAAVVAVTTAAASGVLTARAQKDQMQAESERAAGKALGVDSPTPVLVFLKTHRGSRKLSSPCPFSDGGHALAIGGTYDRPLLLVDGRQAKRASGLCSRIWTWAPRQGEVVALPMPSG
jgi:hypothetical protein